MRIEDKIKNANGITLAMLIIIISVIIIAVGVGMGTYFVLTNKENSNITEKNEENLVTKQQANAQNNTTKEENTKDKGSTSLSSSPYSTPYIPKGFTHTEGTWNNGYTIKEEETGNEFVWVPCVLDQKNVKKGDTVVTFQKVTENEYNEYKVELLPNNTNVEKEDGSAAEIETSVGKYGGFYIAKYEAGIEGEKPNSRLSRKTATDGSIKPLSQKGKGVWNQIKREDAIALAKAMIDEKSTGAKSALISGTAWDTTLQWMVKASDNKESNVEYDINPVGKGWYAKDARDSNYIMKTTGYYAVNNIYDMAGNVSEWTTENVISYGTNCYVWRGGDCSKNETTATRYPNTKTGANSNVGFRVVLYK